MARRDTRRDELYLRDIVDASDAIAGFLTGVSETAFVGSDLIRSAVLQKLSIIGEAAARLSPELRDATIDVPWSAIVGLRNVAVHAYFSVQWPVIWTTATEDVPPLRVQMEAILRVRFGEPPTAEETT